MIPAAVRAESLWTLTTPRDEEGLSRPALMQVADFARSDPAIVGLMFRCGKIAIETVVVLLDPLPPRTTGMISLQVGVDAHALEAVTIPTGAGLLAAFDPTDLAAARWRNTHDIDLTVTAGGKDTKAVLSLDGLSEGLGTLKQSCLTAATAPSSDPRR